MIATLCPDRETLLRYSLGMLPEEQREPLDSHLDSCPDCQAMIVTLDDADDTAIGRLRMPLSGEAVLAEPQLQDALAAAMGMPARAPDAADMPEMLGEYRLIAELGRGGMGRVYKALHTKLDRIVAVKVLPRGRANDENSANRFAREMKAVGRLAHPNIVHAHDAREIDGTAVLIMELVDGLDLAEIVRRAGVPALAGMDRTPARAGVPALAGGRASPAKAGTPALPIPDACELVRQTALALQCAHDHGLVHRDIKPSNIMLARSGEVKLLDLGLARFFTDSGAGVPPAAHEEMTGTGQAMGTADYMAPEQASDSRTVDIRADIYSLGCTFYKLLTGRAPFSGPEYRTTLDKMNAHVHQPAPPIRQIVPEVPVQLAAVLDRMLAKDPSARFTTPAEVAAAIAPFCAGADLPALLKRAERSQGQQGPQGQQSDGNNLSSPSGRGAGGEGISATLQPAAQSRRWKRFAGHLLLLLMVGGLCFALGILIRIHKDGKATTIRAPDGSDIAVAADGQVDVKLPAKAGAAAPNAPPGASVPESTAPRKVAAIRPSIQSTPDYLKTTAKIIGESAAKGTVPGKLLKFDIDPKTFKTMLQAAQKRIAGPDPFADGAAARRPPANIWAHILPVSYSYEAGGGTGFTHFAVVKSLPDHLDPNVAAVPCRATIRQDDAAAAPGMSVRVRVNTGTTHVTLVLPKQTFFIDQGKQFVYVVNGHNSVEPRAVDVGQSEDGFGSAVKGLNRNDIVIADPSEVKPGMTVRPDFIAGALQSPTPPIEFVQTPLKDVAQWLEYTLRIPIHLDERGLAAAGIKPVVPITAQIRDVSFASALKLLLRNVGLTYVVEDDYILITAPGKEPSPKDSQPAAKPAAKKAPAAEAKLPTVRVTQPVVCNVCDYEEYSGRIEPGVVRIPLPGTGNFKKTHFKNGETVREGDVLGEFVSNPYDDPKVQLARDARNNAFEAIREARSSSDAKRVAKAEAEHKAAEDNLQLAIRNAPRITIRAPISGTLGNPFRFGGGNDDKIPFTTMTSPDSMLVSFDVPESTILAHRRMPNRKPNWELSLPVVCGLADDKGFPYRGKVVSVAEGIDSKTHTQRWQAIVPNKDGLFMPGMSVRVRVITSEPHKVMLVPSKPYVVSWTGSTYSDEVLVVNDRNVTEARKVKFGREYDDLSVVAEGLSVKDWIVVMSGYSFQLSSSMAVKPERYTTPSPRWAAISVPTAVSVVRPIAREVSDYADYTGRIDNGLIEVKSPIGGAVKFYFNREKPIKQGALLAEMLSEEDWQKIAPLKDKLTTAQQNVERVKSSPSHFADPRNDLARAEEQVKRDSAELDVIKRAVKYVKILAPCSGTLSSYLGTPSDHELRVDAGIHLLSMFSHDPIYAVFDVDEHTVIQLRRRMAESLPDWELSRTVLCGLSGDAGFPLRGKVTSVDSEIDPKSGTQHWHVLLPNKDGVLLPGMFVRVRLLTSDPHKVLLVPERALGSDAAGRDQGQKFVLVVNGQSAVERRDVEIGQLQDDGLRVVTKGLTGDDRVILDPSKVTEVGMAVKPEEPAAAPAGR